MEVLNSHRVHVWVSDCECFFPAIFKSCSQVVWDWKDPVGHPIYLPAKCSPGSLMPLLGLQLLWNHTKDRISTTSIEKQFCWNAQFTGSLLVYMYCLSLCIPNTQKNCLSFFSRPDYGLSSSSVSSTITQPSCKLCLLIWGAFAVGAHFVLRWRHAQCVDQESLCLSTGMVHVLQVTCHHSQLFVLSIALRVVLPTQVLWTMWPTLGVVLQQEHCPPSNYSYK